MKGNVQMTDYSSLSELLEVMKSTPNALYLERLAYLAKFESLSKGDLRSTNEVITVLRSFGRFDLVESVQEKFLAVKTAQRILAEYPLESILRTIVRQVGSDLIGFKTELLSEKSIARDTINRALTFCSNHGAPAVIRISLRDKPVKLRIDPRISKDALLKDLEIEAGFPLCDYRIFPPTMEDLELLLNQSIKRSKEILKNIALIFKDNMIIINPNDNFSTVSASFRAKLGLF